MTDTTDQKKTMTLRLDTVSGPSKAVFEKGQVKQSFSNRRTKTVEVERKKRRPSQKESVETAETKQNFPSYEMEQGNLSASEMEIRRRVFEKSSLEKLQRERENELRAMADLEEARKQKEKKSEQITPSFEAVKPASVALPQENVKEGESKRGAKPDREKATTPAKKTLKLKVEASRRRSKLTISQALEGEESDKNRYRSLAAIKRARERERQRVHEILKTNQKVLREVTVPETITVADLANRMAVQNASLIKTLMGMGVMVTANQTIDADTAELAVAEFGHKVKRVSESDIEDILIDQEGDDGSLQPRPPVITVMGHVDHGKTSLLDALRDTRQREQEVGGITQHIGAYQVKLSRGETLTFLDTPGHSAFSAIRARGSRLTDIVVLVVAADDGVQPQTVEAINHAKAANVPVVIAINKCDKPDCDPERVKSELVRHGLIPESLGGNVLCVEISALKKTNLDKLEEILTLQAELMELKADPARRGVGVVIESRLEKGLGAIATIIVQNGTLKKGDTVIAGSEWGRIRLLRDENMKPLEAATPSMPVEIIGLQNLCMVGDKLTVVSNEVGLRNITDYRKRQKAEKKHKITQKSNVEQMFQKIGADSIKELAVIVKADTHGSLEAISDSLGKIGNDEVRINILNGGIGNIHEADIHLAKTSNGIVLGFNVRPTIEARNAVKKDSVDVRCYSIIYDLLDDMTVKVETMLKPELKEISLGKATIHQIFPAGKSDKAAGCLVSEGVIKRGSYLRLLRDNENVYQGRLRQLKRFKEDVGEVGKGLECGITFEKYNDVQEGDIIECFEIQEKSRKLSSD